MTVSGCITKDGMFESMLYAHGVCGLSVKANSVLGVQCGKGFYGRCARKKRVNAKF